MFTAFAGCGSGEQTPRGRKLFRMNLSATLTSLDPAQASIQSNVWITSQIFNTLAELDTALIVRPALAQSWTVGDSGKTYAFRLRRGVRFHKHEAFGGPDSTRAFTAADVKYSFERICDPATASAGQWIFSGRVTGVEAFQSGAAEDVSGFAAPDDSTFIIRLNAPFAPFLYLLTMPYASIIPREVVERCGKDFRRNPIGTGPFRLARWTEGRDLVLRRNEDFYEPDLPRIDAAHARFIRSKLSAYAELRNGRLDFIEGVPPELREEILTEDGELRPELRDRFQLIRTPQLTTEYFGVRVANPPEPNSPLLDPKVRRALSLAIDREKLARYALSGLATPAGGFVPEGAPGFRGRPPIPYRPDSARALLAAAGFPGGKGLPEITLHSAPSHQAVSEFVQHEWRKLGVRLRVENHEGAALRQMTYGGEFQLWRASWMADYPDAENYLALFASANHAPDGPNTTHFADPTYDAGYAAALREPDDSARVVRYRELERLALRDQPVIPLYYYQNLRLARKDVRRPPASPMGLLFPLKYVDVPPAK